MDLRAVLVSVRRSLALLILPVVIGTAGAFAILTVQVPKYESTAKVFVSVGNAANANDLSQGSSFAQSAAVNFAALAEQPYVLDAVRAQLGIRTGTDRLAEEMTTDVEESTSIVAITVLDPSAARSAAIANATAARLATAVGQLNPVAQDGTQNVRVTVVRTATAAPRPSFPSWPLGLALGVLGGLLLGVLLVILRELLDTRVRTVEELQRLVGAPVVGRIPRTSGIAAHPLALAAEPDGVAAEGFRLLQLNLEYLRAPEGVAVVGIASALPSEGKSTVAANLALALANAGHRVALVDADLRRPRVHRILGLDNGIGLTEVLVGRTDLASALQDWGAGEQRLVVLPSGATPPNPGELLQSPRLRAVLDGLAEHADVVIVDGPPVLAVADSAVLARTVDAVLLVASLRRSTRSPLVRAVDALHGVGARVLGGVATMTRPPRAESDAYSRYTAPADRRRRRKGREIELVRPPLERADEAPSREQALVPVGAPEHDPGDGGFILLGDPRPGEEVGPDAARSATEPEPWLDLPDVPAETADAEPDGPAARAQEDDATRRTGPLWSRRTPPVPLPVRLSPSEADLRTIRAVRRTLSAEDLRVLRGFPTPRSEPDPQ